MEPIPDYIESFELPRLVTPAMSFQNKCGPIQSRQIHDDILPSRKCFMHVPL